MKWFYSILCFCVMSLFAGGQTPDKAKERMKSDIVYLADDKLEGRLAGSSGEQLASEYISKAFRSLKLGFIPGSKSYIQEFEFNTPLNYTGINTLTISNSPLKLGTDFFVCPVSSNGIARGKVLDLNFGIHAPELGFDDYESKNVEGKIVLINLNSPDGIHPHSKFLKYNAWRDRVKTAVEHKVSAIILYNSDQEISIETLKAFNRMERVNVPVIYVSKGIENQLKDKTIAIETNIGQTAKTARNVMAFLDANASETVVIGAHYDHLGYGEYGNSLYRGQKAIHNGADDNASGIALMLEIARDMAKNQGKLKRNYLFIAFSGEELGLLGSDFFTHSEPLQKLKCSYMLNFDMVGRLGTEGNPILGIYGTGTSNKWDSLLLFSNLDKLEISKSESGMGSSDHTSFYLQNIPAIHFFSGNHPDYHKPTDDEEKINYDGMLQILALTKRLITAMDDDPAPVFIKTQTSESRKSSSFKVTLGIIPDYFGKEKGLGIDGVSEGKPAQKAGLMKGDVIVSLGDKEIVDMMSYMDALKLFSDDDKTTVKVIRAGQELIFDIQF